MVGWSARLSGSSLTLARQLTVSSLLPSQHTRFFVFAYSKCMPIIYVYVCFCTYINLAFQFSSDPFILFVLFNRESIMEDPELTTGLKLWLVHSISKIIFIKGRIIPNCP